MIISVVGSGGKTTLIKKLAKQYREEGKTVLVTTSTHMFIEEQTLCTVGDAVRAMIPAAVLSHLEEYYSPTETDPKTCDLSNKIP